MKIFHSKFVERHYFPHQKMFKSNWLPTSVEMDRDEYKKEMQKLGEILLDVRPLYLLSDTRNLNFELDKELQEWTVKEMLPLFVAAGLKKQAILIPYEKYAQVALEQTLLNLDPDARFRHSFFSDIDEAKAWLFSTELIINN